MDPKSVGKALKEGGASVHRATGGRFSFTLKNGGLLAGAVSMTDHWISVCATSSAANDSGTSLDGKALWSLLEMNGQLEGPVRFAINSSLHESLRADIPAESPTATEELIEVCKAFKGAHGHYARCSSDEGRGRDNPEEDSARIMQVADWNAGLENTRWALVSKQDRIYADLDVPGLVQAELIRRNDDRVGAVVPLASSRGELPAICRQAIATFLLMVSGISRGVRPFVRQESDRTHLYVDYEFKLQDAACGVDRALSSLSVAVGLCGREVRALMQEEVCKAYMSALSSAVPGEDATTPPRTMDVPARPWEDAVPGEDAGSRPDVEVS